MHRCIEDPDETRRAMLRGRQPMEWERSWEYAHWIVEAREKDAPLRLHGSVMNRAGDGGPLNPRGAAGVCAV
jgi:alpha-galactosidase